MKDEWRRRERIADKSLDKTHGMFKPVFSPALGQIRPPS
jgi:hypothetical protein